jgi:hypothetical protein
MSGVTIVIVRLERQETLLRRVGVCRVGTDIKRKEAEPQSIHKFISRVSQRL